MDGHADPDAVDLGPSFNHWRPQNESNHEGCCRISSATWLAAVEKSAKLNMLFFPNLPGHSVLAMVLQVRGETPSPSEI